MIVGEEYGVKPPKASKVQGLIDAGCAPVGVRLRSSNRLDFSLLGCVPVAK